jgi:hypothetical protein
MVGGHEGTNRALTDAWQLSSENPAGLRTFAFACAGTGGFPRLVVTRGMPWLGDTLRFTLSDAPWGRPATLMVGGSASSWGSIPLPLALRDFGAPWCSLAVSPDVLVPFPPPPLGTTWVDLTVPTDVHLVGRSFHTQALAADPGVNALGLIFTDRIDATLGRR